MRRRHQSRIVSVLLEIIITMVEIISSRNLLSVVVVCCLAAAAIGQAAAKEEPNEFLRAASAELQSVNSYLTSLEPESVEPSSVVRRLEEARAFLGAVGDEVVSNGSDGEIQAGFESLIGGNNPKSLKAIFDGLVRASRSCDQEASDFLSSVRDQTFDGQFLHSYTSRRASVCEKVQASIVADKVEKSLGKIGDGIFELVADLAQAYVARDKKASAVSRGQIVISGKQKSVEPGETIRTLKQMQLDTTSQRELFATIVRNHYAEHNPTPEGERVTVEMRRERLRNFLIESLLDPCNELCDRWQETTNYPVFASLPKRRIAETIDERRRANQSFDRSVEMVRICRKVRAESAAILASVER